MLDDDRRFHKFNFYNSMFICVDVSHTAGIIPHNTKYRYRVGDVHHVISRGFDNRVEFCRLARRVGNSVYTTGEKMWNMSTLLRPTVTVDPDGQRLMYPVLMPLSIISEEEAFMIQLSGEDSVDGLDLIKRNKECIDEYIRKLYAA